MLYEILQLFCSAIGMIIITKKSILLKSNIVEEVERNVLSQIMPHTFENIERGFKYLGYFLKPNYYYTRGWVWLIKKIELKINHWC